jgi:hypothetical protein
VDACIGKMVSDALSDPVKVRGDLGVFDHVKIALKLLTEDFSQLRFLLGGEEKFCRIGHRRLQRRTGLLGRRKGANEQAERE